MAARIFGDDDAGERRAREDERERRRESTIESPSRARDDGDARASDRDARAISFVVGGYKEEAKKRNETKRGNGGERLVCV
tara:strand:+ start:3585 stop:3827 length:243 start_codon:yes stop_codon:yes gene_type:complete